MLIIFVLDTSASMGARTLKGGRHGGMSLLDAAKSLVEHYVKVRRI